MKGTLLKSLLLSSAALIFVFNNGQISAQESPNSGRRNSPFSPNPKKKSEIVQPQNAANDKKTTNEKVVSIEASNKAPAGKDNIQFQNTEFENRSAAAKTLEIAKRASSAKLLPTETYKVGAGDVLFISLQNAPAKESTYFTVLKDGTIDYPLAGEMIPVVNLTTDEIETALEGKIKLYENPQVSVNVREHNSHSYTVLGLVEKTGEKFLQREAIPLFVARAEAIVQPRANQVVIKRANSQTETIDLKDKKYEDVLIFSGDIIEFSAAEEKVQNTPLQPQFYYIGGAINSGGQKDFYQGLSLTQAILACGGLKKSSAAKVVIRRKNEEGLLTSISYDLKAIKDGKAADPLLEAGDTIEIEN